jgi:biopolymer transport protein TolR
MSFGRFERTPGPQPLSEINMTPLIDVMLVLLVIFMLAAPLMSPSLQLDLPQAQAARPQSAPQALRVALDKSGQIYVDTQAVSPQALRQRLVALARENPQAEVQLYADETVPYGHVVAVMDAVHQAGLSRVGFAAKP